MIHLVVDLNANPAVFGNVLRAGVTTSAIAQRQDKQCGF